MLRLTCTVPQAWSASETIDSLSASRQAYMTACLILCMTKVKKAGVEGTPGLLKALLEGVSQRLHNPIPSLRCADPEHAILFLCASSRLGLT